MDTIEDTLPELAVPTELSHLISYCEKSCNSGCCGINAFSFSPLHVASYICGESDYFYEDRIEEWNQSVSELESNFNALDSSESKVVCKISAMNQFFTAEAVRALIIELRTSIDAAREMHEYSQKLESSSPASKIMSNYKP